MAIEITSGGELRNWLEDKPPEWARVIALRIALRVLPVTVGPKHWKDGKNFPKMALANLRTMAGSTAAAKIWADNAVWHSSAAAIFIPEPIIGDPRTMAGASAAEVVSAIVGPPSADAARYAADNAAVGVAAYAAYPASGAPFEKAIWATIESDCEALEASANPDRLLRLHLWPDAPDWWSDDWDEARKWLSLPDDNFEIWREWYYGRLEGLPHAFADFDDRADKLFYRWIVEQGDDWWKREPREVNADIKEFVDGLRQPKTAGPSLPAPAELEQNQRAITFTADDNGQVGLATDRDRDGVDHSDGAQERHAEVLQEVHNALEACRPNVTQANDIEAPLARYLNALGGDTHGISPALLIARGEKLRRLIALRKDEFGSAIPFSETQAGALEDWLTAHNLLVGLDPYLSEIERKARGPDAVPTVLDLEALKAVIQSSQAADIPTVEASQALNDVVENVPPDAVPTDRRLIQATEAMKNFIRGVGEVVKKHGWHTVKVTGGGAYLAALWVQRNIEWLREIFASEPSILSILEKIASLPL